MPLFSQKHVLHPELLHTTPFHEETMARIGLTKDKVEAPLEYFSFIRSGIDVFCGYQDYDELKRMR
jgi:hypothetical protein